MLAEIQADATFVIKLEAITNGRMILYGKLGDPVKTNNAEVTNSQTEGEE